MHLNYRPGLLLEDIVECDTGEMVHEINRDIRWGRHLREDSEIYIVSWLGRGLTDILRQ